MENKKKSDSADTLKTFVNITNGMMIGGSNYLKEIIGFSLFDEPKPPQPLKKGDHEDLGNGFSLEIFDDTHHSDYGYLCKDGKKISDEIFRVGGCCDGFKDEFCQLIVYERIKKTKSNSGYTFGDHCIVNEEGKIVLRCKSMMDSIYHLKGVVASMGHSYYNLKTGEMILSGGWNDDGYINENTMSSENFIFLEGHLKNKNVVYQIEYETGKLTTIE